MADKTGASVIEPARVVKAQSDPVSHVEGAWIRYLEHHPDMVERLRLRLPRGKRPGSIRIFGIDRYGLLVTVDTPEGVWEHRVPFPVADEAGLCNALRALMAHPCARRLRPRGG